MPKKRKGPKTHTVLPSGHVQVHLRKPTGRKKRKPTKIKDGPDLRALLDSVKPRKR